MNGRLDRILARHPDLLASLFSPRRRRRRRRAGVRLGNAILEALAAPETAALFACPACRAPAEGPVTVECGHTFCGRCAPPPGARCAGCGAEIREEGKVNVLVKELVDRWRSKGDAEGECGPIGFCWGGSP